MIFTVDLPLTLSRQPGWRVAIALLFPLPSEFGWLFPPVSVPIATSSHLSGSLMLVAYALVFFLAFWIAENPAVPLLDDGLWPLVFVVLLIALVSYLAVLISRATVCELQSSCDHANCLKRFRRWRWAHVTLWALATVVIQQFLGWPQLLKSGFELDRFILVDDLAVIAPALISLLFSWAAFFEVDVVLRSGDIGTKPKQVTTNANRPSDLGHASAPCKSPIVKRYWNRLVNSYCAARLRFVLEEGRFNLGIVLVPVIQLLFCRDVFACLAPDRFVDRHGWLMYLSTIAVICGTFPFLLRFIWITEPLVDQRLRRRLGRLTRGYGLSPRNIRIWRTDDRIANAVIAGFLPGTRHVFLADGLTNRLDDVELEAVVAHEIGHATQHHLILRFLVVCFPLAIIHMLVGRGVVLSGPSNLIIGSSTQAIVSGVLPFAVILIATILAFGWVSRRCEHSADLWACRYLGRMQGMESALERYILVLTRLHATNGLNPIRGGWLHPSLENRVAFLRRRITDVD